MYSDEVDVWGCRKEEEVSNEQKCTCEKVPELNYVSANPDCPIHYPKIDWEKKCIEEFGEWWEGRETKLNNPPPDPGIYPVGSIIDKYRRKIAMEAWLESRRRLKDVK